LDLFLATTNSSQETYTSIRKAIFCRFGVEVLSYDQIKRRVAELSGVIPVASDMCINSCLAYTGPFAELDTCPTCGEPQYNPIQLAASGGKKQVARQQFHTIPIGPQLQALWRDADSALNLRYREEITTEILTELERNEGLLNSYDDFFHGSDYLTAIAEGCIKRDDIVLMFSLDGAQLYQNKASDCWIAIWVVLDPFVFGEKY